MNLFPALIYDTEGTNLPSYGRDNPADGASQPRIVSIAASLIGDISGTVLGSMDCLIKPDGWVSCAEALETHGITHEMGLESGVPIAEAMEFWRDLHSRAVLTSAFNHAHDSKMTRGELRRLGLPDLYGALPDFCCMWGSRDICALPKKKIPSLAEASKILLGIEHNKTTGAHSAAGDRDMTVKLFLELVKRGAVHPKERVPTRAANAPIAKAAAGQSGPTTAADEAIF